MFLGLKRVVSEDFKSTKMHIIEMCKKFNLYQSIEQIGFVTDGALYGVADRIASIKDDIELPIKNRCMCHILQRVIQERSSIMPLLSESFKPKFAILEN